LLNFKYEESEAIFFIKVSLEYIT